MGLFEDYFDPDQFQDSGGLLGRLLSLRPDLDPSQPNGGLGAQGALDAATASVSQDAVQPTALQTTPALAATQHVVPASTPEATQSPLAPGNSPTPSPVSPVSSPAPPSFDFGAHLNAGFQKWAQTPVGNPFAAIANGIAGFNTVQPGDAAFIGPPAPTPSQTPDLGDRLGAAFQNWAHTPVGSPFAALANGITGFNGAGERVACAIARKFTATR